MVAILFFKSFRKQEKALKHRFQPISDKYIKVTVSGFTWNVKIYIPNGSLKWLLKGDILKKKAFFIIHLCGYVKWHPYISQIGSI